MQDLNQNRVIDWDETDRIVSNATRFVQYDETWWRESSSYQARHSPETFAYDDDGNQTLISTQNGLWRVTYNGENRPVRWVCEQSNNQTISNQTILTMTYDHMGRRRTKNAQRFFYDGYLQVVNNQTNTNQSIEQFPNGLGEEGNANSTGMARRSCVIRIASAGQTSIGGLSDFLFMRDAGANLANC